MRIKQSEVTSISLGEVCVKVIFQDDYSKSAETNFRCRIILIKVHYSVIKIDFDRCTFWFFLKLSEGSIVKEYDE